MKDTNFKTGIRKLHATVHHLLHQRIPNLGHAVRGFQPSLRRQCRRLRGRRPRHHSDRFAATEARVYPLFESRCRRRSRSPPLPSWTPVSLKARRRVPGLATRAWLARRGFQIWFIFQISSPPPQHTGQAAAPQPPSIRFSPPLVGAGSGRQISIAPTESKTIPLFFLK
ncbi:hypothetical protein Dimus_039670 [Dionaea muscipula]